MAWRAWIVVGLALVVGCTGGGIDRSDAVPLREALEVRPVADGDRYVDAIAQATRGEPPPGFEVSDHPLGSRTLPPVTSVQVRASTKQALVELVGRFPPAPRGLVPVYEREADDRWALVVVRRDDGFEPSPATLVKLVWSPEPGVADPDGVFLLLDPDDGRTFERLTIDNQGRRLAVVSGDEALMTPVVAEPIGGGQLMITAGQDVPAAVLYERLTGRPAPPRP
jgi:hypothetical protein